MQLIVFIQDASEDKQTSANIVKWASKNESRKNNKQDDLLEVNKYS